MRKRRVIQCKPKQQKHPPKCKISSTKVIWSTAELSTCENGEGDRSTSTLSKAKHNFHLMIWSSSSSLERLSRSPFLLSQITTILENVHRPGRTLPVTGVSSGTHQQSTALKTVIAGERAHNHEARSTSAQIRRFLSERCIDLNNAEQQPTDSVARPEGSPSGEKRP
jgi:hypothetical protein